MKILNTALIKYVMFLPSAPYPLMQYGRLKGKNERKVPTGFINFGGKRLIMATTPEILNELGGLFLETESIPVRTYSELIPKARKMVKVNSPLDFYLKELRVNDDETAKGLRFFASLVTADDTGTKAPEPWALAFVPLAYKDQKGRNISYEYQKINIGSVHHTLKKSIYESGASISDTPKEIHEILLTYNLDPGTVICSHEFEQVVPFGKNYLGLNPSQVPKKDAKELMSRFSGIMKQYKEMPALQAKSI